MPPINIIRRLLLRHLRRIRLLRVILRAIIVVLRAILRAIMRLPIAAPPRYFLRHGSNPWLSTFTIE
jgi:hypothetical protein